MHKVVNLLAKVLAFIIAITATCILIAYIYQAIPLLEKPVHNINLQIYGDVSHKDKKVLHNLIHKQYPSNYLTANLNYLADELLQFAWVEDVVITRDNNFGVNIDLIKRNIVGYWKNKNYLIDSTGQIIHNKQISINQTYLPIIDCHKDNIMQSISTLEEFNSILAKADVTISQLTLQNNIWSIHLNTATTIELYARKSAAKLMKLVIMAKHLLNNEEIIYINLNYTKGLSVKWRTKY
jgi:cell division septal protein FtsQ